ncbi:EF-hand domain-containing protein [Solemya velum gill symbiont]|uniref:EF hand domain-containing protein n=2 Tax=Solemya velum gill symbiont TaxID=2340 RepID=A0A0B0H1R3_SOVGS|nr:EF-hand domain-containing protein [Solemya velum gill symbiont]KHF24158.1 EF hand domain-containing protein [Solemya velum gill symbiont]OOY36097.1 hypothetical protein BOV88_00390 [Solemya velum gill symbiont]OOY38197.1 hypothetical protein BOV89_03690 [Solemya velum gill symbiont]OOY39666.1 hypothetical protein BOV90_08125 [Solemya velum gill symbiont]OOY42703.1 hypothetical protein BOV91_06175 [Solemya velum gill symbiont]
MKKSLITLLVTSAIVASGATFACKGPMGEKMNMIEKFDTDKSGTISEEEFDTGRAARIEKMVSMGRRMKNMGQAPMFADMDTDSDGELSSDEMKAAMEAHRAKRRAMHEAMREERRAMRESRRAMRGPMMGQGSGRHPYCKHHKGKGRHMQPPAFEDIDTNKDGMISPEEFAQHKAERHAK